MSWSEVTITQSGERMLSRMINGAKLIFTRVVIGSETVNEQVLSAQTSVFAPINAPALIAEKTEVEGKNGMQIKIQIRNDGVTETTRMKQIGLYAKTEHDGEVLFGILQDEIGEEIPTYADFSQFLIELWAVIAMSRTNNIQIIESPLVYVTVECFKTEQNNLKSQIAELNEKIGADVEISSSPTPSVGVKTHYYITQSIPEYVPYDPERVNVHDGVIETESGTARGYVQDKTGTRPMALLTE